MIKNKVSYMTTIIGSMLIPSLAFSNSLDMFVMQDIEDTHESLISYLAGGDHYASLDNIDEMEALYHDLDIYFSTRKDGKDGRAIIKNSFTLLNEIRHQTEKRMYQPALEISKELSNECKQCHTIYKDKSI